MRAINNRREEEWRLCDRCGFIHPLSTLQKQKGLLVCTCHGCYDDTTDENRQDVINDVLSDGQEGKSDLPALMQGPDEVTFG